MLIRYLKCMAALALAASTTAIALVGTPARAQSQGADSVPVTRTVGILDTDGSALYRVLFESASDPLGSLTVTNTVPANTTFVEAVSAPDGAIVTVAPDQKSVSWQFASLDANTILGPFTFRAKAADPGVALPAGTSAEVSWTTPGAGSVNASPPDGTLQPLDTSGQLIVDAKGTVDAQGQPTMLAVGKTGISVYVPAGAVSQSVTLTFTRATATTTGSPDLDKQWWLCAGIDVTSVPAVTLAQPIEVLVPTRQVLTPGLATQLFVSGSAGPLQVIQNGLTSVISPDGSHMLFQYAGQLIATPSARLSGKGMIISVAFKPPQLGSPPGCIRKWGQRAIDLEPSTRREQNDEPTGSGAKGETAEGV
ncbi:MAG: hypothetical protein ACYDBJ_11690 [Aggregatilineales bacterium]